MFLPNDLHRMPLSAAAFRLVAAMLLLAGFWLHGSPAQAQSEQYYSQPEQYYSMQEVVDAGHKFFGATSGALATAVEKAFSRYGMPNGYVLGEEAAGAFIGGLRYGEGYLFTKNAGEHKVFWQGPSVGWDYGIDGNRTMMLVYNLPSVDYVYNRFYGLSGSAYLVGGVGVTALTREGVNVVPIHTGLGARLGINIGYLKMSREPRVNPF
jgi:hypothetical protein